MVSNKKANKLIDEKSPYLQQHAYNPVNWYPWGEEAFQKAKNENKPIFLSIGYSTCHWCHVMERESFENEEIAKILNKNFISIKVDREELPDVDKMYMDAAIMYGGNGGWPLSVFIDHDKIPFFAGTYFPRDMFKENLEALYDNWINHQDKIQYITNDLMLNIKKSQLNIISDEINYSVVEESFNGLSNIFDEVFGGFGNEPKFPTVQNLLFLMRYYFKTRDKKALLMVDTSLNGMHQGGIFDHVGGGFARYSVDKQWLVPHFEKMMYDNGMLIIAYTEAGKLIDKKYFKVAERIIEYCSREMIENEGFFTAQDADSEGEEGKFYVFTPNEVIKVLGKDDGNKFCQIFDITEEGNFEGKSIPNLIKTNLNNLLYNEDEYDEEFALKSFEKLYEYRSKRTPPLKDKKILSFVNGIMIYALAKAGRYLDNKTYVEMSENLAEFVLEKMFKDGRLFTSYQEGVLKNKGVLDDYAFIILGLIELNQVTLNDKWLNEAEKLTKKAIDLFYENGEFYLTGNDVENLPLRTKSIYDGAIPSGNNIMMENLIKLYNILNNDLFYDVYNKTIHTLYDRIKTSPMAFTSLMGTLIMEENGGTHLNLDIKIKDLEYVKEKLNFYNPFLTTKLILNENESKISICENRTCLPSFKLNEFDWKELEK